MSKMLPLHDLVVVKRIEKTKTTLSGIVIPDTAGERPEQGVVVQVGPGKKNEAGERTPVCVNVGDTVVWQVHTGQAVKIDGVEYLILKEAELLAVIENDNS